MIKKRIDPSRKLKMAYGVVFFVGGLNVLIGLATVFFRVTMLTKLGIGFPSIVVGLIFLGLGFYVRRESRVALGLAIVLFIFDGILSIVFVTEKLGTVPTGAIVVRAALLVSMIQGLGAIRALRHQRDLHSRS